MSFAQSDSLGRAASGQPNIPMARAGDSTGVVKKKFRKPMTRPLRAALLSAALPGAGQYYNKSLWYIRVPIIYGAAAGLGMVIKFNHTNYIGYRDAYLYSLDNNPLTEPPARYSGFPNDALRARRDSFRRDRDFFIILSAALYALNIAEAATTAHLSKFDVSEDLTLQVAPSVLPGVPGSGNAAVGLSFHFTLKN